MTIPFYCLAATFLLLLITKGPLAWAMERLPGGYDNRHPREQQARLTGWGARALAAHKNTLEAFAPFAAAVLVAHLTGADPFWSATLAVIYVVARILYPIFYLADWGYLRSTTWFVGYFVTGGLFLLPILS